MALLGAGAYAQDGSYDVFTPIGKYISHGDAESLSAWFDDSLEISVSGQSSSASRTQARQIVKAFFENYTPSSFDFTHTVSKGNMKYALGSLKAGGETFTVTIFVSAKHRKPFLIQQMKIEQAL